MTAAYSPRPNTEAAEWANQVPDDEKARRLREAQELVDAHALERSQAFLGRTQEVSD